MLAYRSDPSLKEVCISSAHQVRVVFDKLSVDEANDVTHFFEVYYGIPSALLYLAQEINHNCEDESFDGLFAAVRPGADLSHVSDQFIHWILTDPEGARKNACESDVKRLDRAAAFYESRLEGVDPPQSKWEEMRFAAPFGMWLAAREDRPQVFASLAFYAFIAGHDAKTTRWVPFYAAECTSKAHWKVMSGKFIELNAAAW